MMKNSSYIRLPLTAKIKPYQNTFCKVNDIISLSNDHFNTLNGLCIAHGSSFYVLTSIKPRIAKQW